MTVNSQEPISQIPPDKSTRLTDREIKLKKCFERIGDPRLARILEGVVKVLADADNPDRFAQAAHSIRQITSLLTRSLSHESIEQADGSSADSGKEGILKEIKNSFEKALDLMPHDDEISKKEQTEIAKQRLVGLLKDVESGKISMRQKLRTMYGTEVQLRSTPPKLKSTINTTLAIWSKLHHYFSGVSKHSGDVDQKVFFENLFQIQDCWWSACRIFIDTSPEIDQLIQTGPAGL